MSRFGKKLSIVLSILMVTVSLSGLSAFAEENEIPVNSTPEEAAVSLYDISQDVNTEEIALIDANSTETADKSALSAAVTTAEAIYAGAAAGDQPGQYPQAAKDALGAAIDAAKQVLNGSEADQEGVNSAVTALNTAVDTFKAAVIEEISADINSDGTVNVVDLAAAAYYYDKNSASEGWDQAKTADVNHDGKIDISDLTYIAINIID